MRELTDIEMNAVAGGISNATTQAIVDIVFAPVAVVVGLIEMGWKAIFG